MHRDLVQQMSAADLKSKIDRFVLTLTKQRPVAEYFAGRLIDALDSLDGDPDLEDGGDTEHTMGRCETGSGMQGVEVSALIDECEPDDDLEPSLGSSVCQPWHDQTLWTHGDDQEEVDEDGGDINDLPQDTEPDELDLGAPENHHDQREWAPGKTLRRTGTGRMRFLHTGARNVETRALRRDGTQRLWSTACARRAYGATWS